MKRGSYHGNVVGAKLTWKLGQLLCRSIWGHRPYVSPPAVKLGGRWKRRQKSVSVRVVRVRVCCTCRSRLPLFIFFRHSPARVALQVPQGENVNSGSGNYGFRKRPWREDSDTHDPRGGSQSHSTDKKRGDPAENCHGALGTFSQGLTTSMRTLFSRPRHFN